MDDDPALLAAILADPADDTPRLVYADWLDEHAADPVPCGCGGKPVPTPVTTGHRCPLCGGRAVWRRGVHFEHQMRCVSDTCRMPAWEPGETVTIGKRCGVCSGSGSVIDRGPRQDRAEFIRVQVELAKLGKQPACECQTGPAIHGCPKAKWENLKKREDALLTARGREWSREVAAALGVDCSRGVRRLSAADIREAGLSGDNWYGVEPADGWAVGLTHLWQFARGFPFSVRVPTLAEVIGDRDCPRCEGRGATRHWFTQELTETCKTCSGLGRVRACPGCGGQGVLPAPRPTGPGAQGYVMPVCDCDAGTLPCLAPRLAGLPVERVWVADRAPMLLEASSGRVGWWCGGVEPNAPAIIPHEVFELLDNDLPSHCRHACRVYATTDLASAALAAAVATAVRKSA